jgi:large subunit ribosomal protein L4
MTVYKQFSYEVLDSEGIKLPEKPTPVSLRVNESAPKYLIHKAIVIQDCNRRQGTASSKTRSEVRGGGKKPWKQKGTGQARSGSSNSPLWKGGGVTFGPKPRVYKKKINLKEKQLALSTTFYNSTYKMTVVQNSFNTLQTPKTKGLVASIQKLLPSHVDKKILIVAHEINQNLMLAVRNLPNTQLLYSHTTNLKDLIAANCIIITEQALLQITH